MSAQPSNRPRTSLSRVFVAVLAFGTGSLPFARAEAPGPDRLRRSDGAEAAGRLRLDPGAGFLFDAEGGGTSRPASGAVVEFSRTTSRGATVPPMFQVSMGRSGRISGALQAVAEGTVKLAVPWRVGPIVARRPGARSVEQRRGEAQVLADDFDVLGPAWSALGQPRAVVEAGESAAFLPGGGSSIERRFDEPITAGRVDLTFHDDGKVHAGRSWSLVLAFRAPGGPAVVRVLLGWAEESMAVESPDGPALVVQRLARSEGWRRLAVRFDARRTEIAVDGEDLAHGRGVEGPLESIRIAVEGEGQGGGDEGPDGLIGAIRVVRFATLPSGLEIDPTQDEARLVVGDQLFGTILRGDRDRVAMIVDDRPTVVEWRDLAGIHFRRDPAAGDPIAGALARVEWDAGAEPGREPDFAEGAVVELSETSLTLETSYAGTLAIPRERLVRLEVLEPGLRLVIDPCSHHLGDEISVSSPALDPPMHEGGVLERSFVVPEDAPAVGPAAIVLDVVGVVGEATGLMFSDMVRRGELRTHVLVDGERIDYVNRYIDDANETPRRIRIPVPDGLTPGRHVLRLEQTGDARDPTAFDDLGVLAAAVEFTPAAPAPRP